MNKNELRQHFRAQRQMLSHEHKLFAATQVVQHITRFNRYRFSQHIAFYLSFDGELNPEALLLQAHQTGKHCYLPVLHPRKIDTLAFIPYTPGDSLVPNRFGILEPQYSDQKNYPAWHLDIVFTPLVAFDQHKRRLGMGQGYYDRTFAFLNQTPEPKPYLVGLAYEIQQAENVPVTAHDVCLQTVVTEAGIL